MSLVGKTFTWKDNIDRSIWSSSGQSLMVEREVSGSKVPFTKSHGTDYYGFKIDNSSLDYISGYWYDFGDPTPIPMFETVYDTISGWNSNYKTITFMEDPNVFTDTQSQITDLASFEAYIYANAVEVVYLAPSSIFTKIANKIREKVNGLTSLILCPDGFISEIDKLTDTRDANAVAGDIRNNKTAYVNGSKITGNLEELGATTYNTSTADQSIASPKILTGNQTIKAVTTSNIDAGNIKAGVTVKVGDDDNAGRIKSVSGTFTSDGNAAAGDIRKDKIAYVNGSKVTGTKVSKSSTDVSVSGNTVSIPAGIYDSAVSKTVGTKKDAATYYTSSADQSIAAGYYLSGAQTIKAVTTSNIDAVYIKKGVTVKVGDANNAGRIKNVTGSYVGKCVYYGTSDGSWAYLNSAYGTQEGSLWKCTWSIGVVDSSEAWDASRFHFEIRGLGTGGLGHWSGLGGSVAVGGNGFTITVTAKCDSNSGNLTFAFWLWYA